MIGTRVTGDCAAQMDFVEAAKNELQQRVTRHLPPRPDRQVLAPHSEELGSWVRNRYTKGTLARSRADRIYIDKMRGGLRPLSVLGLDEAILYRALVERERPARTGLINSHADPEEPGGLTLPGAVTPKQ